MNLRKHYFPWILLGILLMVWLVGCSTDGLPNAMLVATADAYTFQTQVANGQTDPEYATEIAQYHATQICETNSWYCDAQSTATPIPPTATPSPTPTVTPFGGPMGTCFALPWDVRVTSYEEIVSQATRVYPSGIPPVCSSDSMECVGVHIYCYVNGIWDGQDRGIPVEQPIIQEARPYIGWVMIIAVGLPLLIVCFFAIPIAMNYMKAVMSESEFGPLVAGQMESKPLTRRGEQKELHISVQEFRNIMAQWNQKKRDEFFQWLINVHPEKAIWRKRLNPHFGPCVISVKTWYELLLQWNKVQTGKFMKWMDK